MCAVSLQELHALVHLHPVTRMELWTRHVPYLHWQAMYTICDMIAS